MPWEKQYQRVKAELLSDEKICKENRKLFERFFALQEYKLKRMNRLSELDAGTYKTLLYYASRFRTVNRWFTNQSWEKLTKEDIKRVYDDVEDGVIRTLNGKHFRGRETYYNKILCGKPFELAGKRDLAREILEYRSNEKTEVRFIREEDFRKLVQVVMKPEHKALLWLAWDVGENAGAMLQLRRSSFTRGVNEYTKEPEYTVAFRQEILKRSRTPRTETTNYKETLELLDLVLRDMDDDDLVFDFGTRMAAKVLNRAVRITGVRCIPSGLKVTLKDLRSSMACDLLRKGWTTDEVNRRLGHKPSSREIDKYVNWLALDGRLPKRKFHKHQVGTLQLQIDELTNREKLSAERIRRQGQENDQLKSELDRTQVDVQDLRKLVERSIASLTNTRRKSVQAK